MFYPFAMRKLMCLTISSAWLATHRPLHSSISLYSTTSSFWGKPHITVHTTEVSVNPKILKPNSYWQRVPLSKGGQTSLPQTLWSVLPRLKYCSKLYFDYGSKHHAWTDQIHPDFVAFDSLRRLA